MFTSRLSHWAAALLAAAGLTMFLAFAAPTPAAAQYYDEDVQEEIREGDYEDLEYEPGEGLHEEEWYDPSDWFDVSPGISYEDGDGRFEQVRYIFAYDLDRATRSSDLRREQAIRRDVDRRTRGPHMVSGELADLTTLKLSGFQQDHLLARVKTKEGRTARVDLGPKNKYADFQLEEGDKVRVMGVRGRINDKPVLLARHVETDRGTVRIHRPAGMSMKRFDGTLLSLRSARFRNVQEPQVIAKFKTDQGRTFSAILGSKSQLNKLDLSEGDEVALLATPSRLQGRPILVARQIRTGETTLAVSPPRVGRTVARQPLREDSERHGEQQQRDAQGERQPQRERR